MGLSKSFKHLQEKEKNPVPYLGEVSAAVGVPRLTSVTQWGVVRSG